MECRNGGKSHLQKAWTQSTLHERVKAVPYVHALDTAGVLYTAKNLGNHEPSARIPDNKVRLTDRSTPCKVKEVQVGAVCAHVL